MGWLGRIFGREQREARRRAEAVIREALERDDADAAWRALITALEGDHDSDSLLHLGADVLRRGGARELAELFGRAADQPHDPRRLLDLGSTLLSGDEPEAAAAILERALAFVPFDAIVRSELALAQARAGRPRQVLETLALHPCLADDRGALFEFGWAAMLTGDLQAAEGALRELSGASALRRKLESSLARARLGMAARPGDARDYYFIEHGGLVLDALGPRAGRYGEIEMDAVMVGRILAGLAAHLADAPAPRRVIPLTEADRELAERVAEAIGGEVQERGKGRLPAGLAVTLEASALGAVDTESWEADAVSWLALTMAHHLCTPRAPDYVGAFARRAVIADDALVPRPPTTPDPSLLAFARARRAHLPPTGARVRSAFFPDAPLPR